MTKNAGVDGRLDVEVANSLWISSWQAEALFKQNSLSGYAQLPNHSSIVRLPHRYITSLQACGW